MESIWRAKVLRGKTHLGYGSIVDVHGEAEVTEVELVSAQMVRDFEREDNFSGFGLLARFVQGVGYGSLDRPAQEIVFGMSRKVTKGRYSPQTVIVSQIWALLSVWTRQNREIEL